MTALTVEGLGSRRGERLLVHGDYFSGADQGLAARDREGTRLFRALRQGGAISAFEMSETRRTLDSEVEGDCYTVAAQAMVLATIERNFMLRLGLLG